MRSGGGFWTNRIRNVCLRFLTFAANRLSVILLIVNAPKDV
jgi:hypothetical protein